MKTYTVDDKNKTIQIVRRLSPLLHHAKLVERLQEDYPGYTILPPK